MNREIKFRGQITRQLENGGSWAYWGITGADWIDSLDPDTFGQYTGLKDKNGVDIYEGDICEFMIGIEREEYLKYNDDTKGSLRIISWVRSAWGFVTVFPDLVHPDDKEERAFYVDPFDGDDWSTERYFEVIGNIHENPELLDA